jgi:ketosteroid isomerase-like protein
MRKLIYLVLAVATITACQQEQRYFAESAEIETLKSGILAFENGDWDTWRSHFADTAKVFNNSKDGIAVDQRMKDLQGMTSAFSSYGFDHEEEFVEMVIDKEKESWVYYWADYNGTANNGKEISVPVHLAVRFVDGKIVTEHIYFDATELNAVMAEMAAAEAAEAESVE